MQNFGFFGADKFPALESVINYLSGECSDRLIKQLGALEWLLTLPNLANLGIFFQGYIKNKMYLNYNSQSLSCNFLQQHLECRNMLTVLIRNRFEVWSTDADDAKMLLDIPFPMSQVITDQLAFNSVNICLDNMLQILCMLCKNWED